VYATDISEKQIKNAIKQDNIFYKVESAEKTSFPNCIKIPAGITFDEANKVRQKSSE